MSNVNQKFKLSLIVIFGLSVMSMFNAMLQPEVHAARIKISKIKTTNSYQSRVVTSTLSKAEQAAQNWIATKESTNNYNAHNGQYYGKYQLNKTLLNGDYSPANQEAMASQYVTTRYGSWVHAKQFWLQHGWY